MYLPGRTCRRFLLCWLLLFFIQSFSTILWCCSSFIAFRRHPLPFRELSPGHRRVIRDTFSLTFLDPSVTVLPRVLRIWENVFPSPVFFTLHSFPTFGTTCFYQGFPGSRQFFLEGCRAIHWCSKHRSGPSVCLNHTVFSKRY